MNHESGKHAHYTEFRGIEQSNYNTFFIDPIVLGVPNSKIAKDIEDAIMKAGGLGKFQIWSFFVIVTGMVSGAFWLYSLQYFERVPQEWFCKETE